MVTITVKQFGGPEKNLTVGTGIELLQQGLETLDPPLRMNSVIRGAFQVLPERVEIVGEKHIGAFTRADDFVRIEVRRGRMLSTRYTVYGFSGWKDKT